MNTCRFCKLWKPEPQVKYGVRHYAHFDCYLDAGKDIFRLHRWQVDQFPYRLLQQHGLIEKIESTKRIGNLIGNW